jgi:Polyketide cyclase / dehydrase and lipid transport
LPKDRTVAYVCKWTERENIMKKTLLVCAALLASTAIAHAVDVSKTVASAAAPDAVWARIGDFCGIAKWHPAVGKCEMAEKDGATWRTLSLKGGGAIIEKQLARDDKAMSYSYAITESPLPVANYQSTISVTPNGAGSTIIWVGKFDAKGATEEEAAKVMSGIYEAGLAELAK